MNKVIKPLIHGGDVEQKIKAPLDEVLKIISYENIPLWSKKFRNINVISRDKNRVIARIKVRVMGFNLAGQVTGDWYSDHVDEEIKVDDGTILHEHVSWKKIPEGTVLRWTGDLVRFGKITKYFGFLMGKFFAMDTKREFKRLANYFEKIK